MVPYTGRGRKNAIFGKTWSVGHQIVPYTGRVRKSAIFGKTLTVGHQMVPYAGTRGQVRVTYMYYSTMTMT